MTENKKYSTIEEVLKEIDNLDNTKLSLINEKNKLGRTESHEDMIEVLKKVEEIDGVSFKKALRVFIMDKINERILLNRKLREIFENGKKIESTSERDGH